jgi:hypothetical protein
MALWLCPLTFVLSALGFLLAMRPGHFVFGLWLIAKSYSGDGCLCRIAWEGGKSLRSIIALVFFMNFEVIVAISIAFRNAISIELLLLSEERRFFLSCKMSRIRWVSYVKRWGSEEMNQMK